MPSNSNKILHKFHNCRLLRDNQLIKDDLWIRDGIIENPQSIFYGEHLIADIVTECDNLILAPGFIDLQVNGAFGIDFSSPSQNVENDLRRVAKGILANGVTSFCPTIVTVRHSIYKELLPHYVPRNGSQENGAGMIGLHLEGPFINKEKRGAHLLEAITDMKNGISDLLDVYGNLDNVAIITIAPEIPGALSAVDDLTKRGIITSLGHSTSTLAVAEEAVNCGARCITHLFNAMLPFHHRDPHLVGLLTSDKIPPDMTMFYGLIADGIHTHPAALSFAHRIYQKGMILVTDAIPAMGLPSGIHPLGCQMVEVKDNRAVIAGTDLLCGSIATMDQCVRFLLQSTGCNTVEALESASLHPAQLLGITHRKGTLDFGTDADFVLLDEQLRVRATYIAGQEVWRDPSTVLNVRQAS